MAIPAGNVLPSRPNGAQEPVEPILMDESLLCSVDAIMSHFVAAGDVLDIEELMETYPIPETSLTPSRLEGIGREKVDKLAAFGIVTVEALAQIDVDPTKAESIKQAIQITGNRRRDGAIRTLSGWKLKALAYLNRRQTNVFKGR